METLEIMRCSGRFPRELKNYIKENQEELLAKTKSVYHTGKVS